MHVPKCAELGAERAHFAGCEQICKPEADEGAVAAEEKLDARVTHAAESMEPRGIEPLTS